MRSISPLRLAVAELPPAPPPASIALDPETAALYVAAESPSPHGVHVDILQVIGGNVQPIASFSSPVRAPFSKPEYAPETLSLHYLPDERSLVILLAGGDIATLALHGPDGSAAPVEVVGSVDSGIKAAAWSPDDEQIILVTGEDNLVCMTRNFDVVHEEPLRSQGFGQDKFINVGWGSKSTQFHGSLGKSAARQPTDTAPSVSHPTDHGLPVISFRGDASFFAVSSLDPYHAEESESKSESESGKARRQVRIYARDASAGFQPKLSATSESLPGLEPALAWRPSGNLISTIVRYGYHGGGEGRQGRWDVAMLERNGLRHGGFELREDKADWEDGRIRGLGWNADSEILAVWIERKDRDVVQLWSMKNYHYYLKQELYSHDTQKPRFRGFKWHPEDPLSLYIICQDAIQHRTFTWDTFAARLPMPHDTASVAVIDGTRLLLTPFRTQNTPPPMSSYHLTLPSTPVHACLSNWDDTAAAVFANGHVIVWKLNTRLPGPKGSKLRGGGQVAEPVMDFERRKVGDGGRVFRNLALGPGGKVAVLSLAVGRAGAAGGGGTTEQSGWVNVFVGSKESIDMTLPSQPTSILLSGHLLFTLSPTSKLHVTSLTSSAQHPISVSQQPVTSFTLTSSFLIFTTTSHFAHFAPLTTLEKLANTNGDDLMAVGTNTHEMKWEERRVERGAKIVVASESEMSLVLQATRGNLETVYPRPMVLQVVKRDVLAKHRLDLNILYDLDPEKFMANLENFVEQVHEVDYLNLFVSSLNSEDSAKAVYGEQARENITSTIPADKVNTICDALRALLEARGLEKYVETILTTHVCKIPPDYESGLRVLLQLQADHPEIVEDAIKYIIFLSDDPKEYLPFLRELRALDKWDQRFKIDDHLERRESALANLTQAGPERFEDAASYLAKYELYDTAFKLYKDDQEKLIVIHDLYGDYLYDRRDYTDSALSYLMANKPQKALKAYERAHAWRELFALAKKEGLSKESLDEMIERVTDYLGSRGRHLEASQIFIEYSSDVDSAVDTCCRGAEFSEAYRLTSIHDRSDLVEAMIHPGLEEAHEALIEVFEEMDGQLDKETKRLKELNEIREKDHDAFYIVEREIDIEGVDVATNATTVASAFTRYTVAPSTMFSQTTRMTGQTAKSKRGKKRATGRRGTVDEWEYLVMSIGRLLARVDEKSAEALTLLRHLILASSDHVALAQSLQSTIIAFRTKLSSALDEAWQDRDAVLKEVVESGGSGLEGGLEKSLGEVKPHVGEWKGMGLLLSN
ncbi:elongator complex protein 1 [Cryptococcus deuterogattii Ram5]|uniref:Elongator complex protein 1 n=1 Tax=Cryptococcus deuterogattii Ram5 TaxID=1296110 RepID=A0A0D0V693_9TREE|nr:elongator complex protein 1 [Cryptococcus deuterogattii Ram5]